MEAVLVGSHENEEEHGEREGGGLRCAGINDSKLEIFLEISKRLGFIFDGGFQHLLPDAHDALGADGVSLGELEYHLCLDLFSAEFGILVGGFHVA